MIGWLNARRAGEFGASLAQNFIDKMPPGAMLNESKLASKTEYLLTKMQAQIKAFKQEEALNFYKKAKLSNAFKWKLKDAGYDDAFIEKLMEWLVLHV